MTIIWSEIKEENATELRTVMKLYDQSFPIDVREPHEIFHRSIKYSRERYPNNFRFLIGKEDDQLVSFATGHYLADDNVGFIVYIATNPLARNSGLGSKTLVKLEELLNEDARSAGHSSLRAIFLETETEDLVHTEQEKADCEKRNRFFDRNSYKKYEEISYLQPPLHEGMDEVPLNLFIKNVQKDELMKQEIQHAIQAIYREKYINVNNINKEMIHHCLKKMGINELPN
ncbi:MAG: GNAT family N-acetyltransferase [Neobacillus sp.]